MIVKTFPELFGSYKVYEIVKNVLSKQVRDKESDLIIRDLINAEAKPNDFIKKMGLLLKKYVSAPKSSEIILSIKEKLRELIDIELEPVKIEMAKTGSKVLKLVVVNNVDTTVKIRAGLQQIDRKYTALIHDNVKNFGYTKIIKTQIVDGGKLATFKFLIKPDVFGIQDLHELNKNKELNIMLGAQVEVDSIEGIQSGVKKIPVRITKAGL